MRPTVLFVGTGNSCRSQMAEALLRRQTSGTVDVLSAGIGPRGIHPLTLRVLEESGCETSSLTSTSIFDLVGSVQPDYLITVCPSADRACPIVWPAKTIWLHWPFDDPERAHEDDEHLLAEFRRTRDDISLRICAWLLTRPFDQSSIARAVSSCGIPDDASTAFL